MTLEAKELYQKAIVEHGKHPKNTGGLAGATHEATGNNPLCGDRVTLRLCVEEGRIVEARFEARGCMIATASASLLTEAVKGRSTGEAIALVEKIEALVGEGDPPLDLGDLEVLRAAREFPARRACVTLSWGALRKALSAAKG